jgi:hypothetical protein
METRLLVMTPDFANERRTFELPKRPTAEEVGQLVALLIPGCERAEHFEVQADFNGGLDFKAADMFADLERVRKKLPWNENATVILRRAAVMQGEKNPKILPWIAGPAVLFQRRVWGN